MPPRFVYGDSYGQLANNELALDAARDARYFQSLSDNRARQQHIDSVAMAQQQMEQDRINREAAMLQAFAFHNDDLASRAEDQAYRRDALAQNLGMFNAQLQNNLQLADMASKERNAQRTLGLEDQLYNEAYQGIVNGFIRSPEQLNLFVGNRVTPENKQRLGNYLAEAQRRVNQQYGLAEQLAGSYNAALKGALAPFEAGRATAQAQLDNAPEKSFWRDGLLYNLLGPTTKDRVNQLPITQYNKALSDFTAKFAKDKNAQRMVAFDAENNTFVPTLPMPEGYRPVVPSTPATPGLPKMVNAGGPPSATEAGGGKEASAAFTQLPGTNSALRSDVANYVLAEGNKLKPNPGETPDQFYTRRKLFMAQLARDAMSKAANVVRPVERIPWVSVPPDGWGD